jgi:hypothetical protein
MNEWVWVLLQHTYYVYYIWLERKAYVWMNLNSIWIDHWMVLPFICNWSLIDGWSYFNTLHSSSVGHLYSWKSVISNQIDPGMILGGKQLFSLNLLFARLENYFTLLCLIHVHYLYNKWKKKHCFILFLKISPKK